MRVLIVDDDQIAAGSLADMVSLLGHETEVVLGPRQAIHSIGQDTPALILLDLNMPGVDGLEVCRYIKREPSSMNIPVVFISAEDDPSVKEQAKEAGASGYLVKPVDFDSLEEILVKTSNVSKTDKTSKSGKTSTTGKLSGG